MGGDEKPQNAIIYPMKNKTMTHTTIGIFYDPWNPDWEIGKTRVRLHGFRLCQLYRQVIWYKARPRREKYMRQLFREKFPEGTFIHVKKGTDIYHAIRRATTIILLYPDANGLGFNWLEWLILGNKQPFTNVKVLNGRRRLFVLSHAVYLQLMLRRFMERTMLAELLTIIPFVIISPVLLLYDRWRRHA